MTVERPFREVPRSPVGHVQHSKLVIADFVRKALAAKQAQGGPDA